MGKKAGKIALALGLITGTLTGLLFAPTKGKDLRKKIMSERGKGGTGTKALGNDIKKMGKEIFDLMKDIAETDQVQKLWGKTKGTVKGELDVMVKKAHDKAEEMKKLVSEYAGKKKSKK